MWDRAAELGFWMSPSYAPTLWLWALGVLLLLALRRWRTINASALRAFFLLVAFQGLLFLGMNAGAAALAKRLHNPSDFLTAGALLTAASWLVAGYKGWRALRDQPGQSSECEPLPAPAWGRLGLTAAGLVFSLVVWLVALVGLVAVTSPLWWAILLSPDNVVSSIARTAVSLAQSLWAIELMFALVIIGALGLYRRLSLGNPSAQRGCAPTLAVKMGVWCLLLAVFVRVATPLELAHDRVLLEIFREAVAHDDESAFRLSSEELARRPPDCGHSLRAGSRQLRALAGGPEALSATLYRHRRAHPLPTLPGEYWLTWVQPPAVTEPELSFLSVLLKRGEQAEVVAWLGNPEVPIEDRRSMAQWWSRQRPRSAR
jgi:hypothetical protein